MTDDRNHGTILRIQRMSTEDGPGIRSTVFFKGCPLSCLWCHNPESISPAPQLHWEKARCIGCASCVAACAAGALAAAPSGIRIDRLKCTSCGDCTRACPSTALAFYGKSMGLDDLVAEVLKDRVYFEKSGGGVTLSGGEPTLQAGFARGLLRELKSRGIHTALDTCGQCAWETLEGLVAHTDLVLYDIKLMYRARHKEYTGVGNERILDNILRLAGCMQERGMPKALWIRTPAIPGYTADAENIRVIGRFIREKLLPAVSKWEICAFNNLCLNKYEGLGIDWALRHCEPLTEGDAKSLGAIAGDSGVDPSVVHVTGPTRKGAHGEQHGNKVPMSVIK